MKKYFQEIKQNFSQITSPVQNQNLIKQELGELIWLVDISVKGVSALILATLVWIILGYFIIPFLASWSWFLIFPDQRVSNPWDNLVTNLAIRLFYSKEK